LKWAVHICAMVKPADIKRARKRLGESQAVFARRFNVDQSTVHRWEEGDLVIKGITAIGVEAVLADLSIQRSQAAE
jgi:DNA-binding transcriptional regulator YiaG